MVHSKSAERILMVGYYGHGNFGDDVLMLVTYRLLRHRFPEAEISVLVSNPRADYITKLLGNVILLTSSIHGHFDRIVHGGGGVFFDFNRYGIAARLREVLTYSLGFQAYLAAERLLRRILGKPRIRATHRIGIGIGVGTFAPGSAKLREKLPLLADFAALWVRDVESMHNLKRFTCAMKAEVLHGSDLAFLTYYWLPALPEKPPALRPRLGIVLRDWPGMDMAQLAPTLAQLAQDYDITGFIFDDAADAQTSQLLAPYTTHRWQPQGMEIAAFAATLAAQDVLLTSRAHGAICGACVGVPSAIIDLEPKLQQVQAMLATSSVLVAANDPARWASAIAQAHAQRHHVAADVAINRAQSETALQQMQRWLLPPQRIG